MSALFVVLNQLDDIVYAKSFNFNEKEYCTMYLIAYSCVDHFANLRKSNEDFFPCIEKHFCWNVTSYFLRNGMSFILINKECDIQDIILFFESVELKMSAIFLQPSYEYKNYIENDILNKEIEKYYVNLIKDD